MAQAAEGQLEVANLLPQHFQPVLLNAGQNGQLQLRLVPIPNRFQRLLVSGNQQRPPLLRRLSRSAVGELHPPTFVDSEVGQDGVQMLAVGLQHFCLVPREFLLVLC